MRIHSVVHSGVQTAGRKTGIAEHKNFYHNLKYYLKD